MAGTERPDNTPPAEPAHEEPDMTAILDRDPPVTETVHDGADPLDPLDPVAALADDSADIDAQIRFEVEFLTSLVWAPDTAAAVHALVGDHAHRAAHSAPHDRIPLAHLPRLFLSSSNAAVFAAVTELVDEGSPVSPALLHARIGRTHRLLQPILLEIAAPRGHGPMPGGVDVPPLARALVDSYYRRGYTNLVHAMHHAIAEAPTDDLSAHWVQLTDHQQAAERRRLAITDALAIL